MLSQVNASQNSRQTIDNIHNDFQPFACIMNEKFDNIPKNQSNYYLRDESKKEYWEDTTQNKADKLLTSLQRDNQSKRQAKKIELSWDQTFTKLFCNRDSTNSQVNISLSMFKILKFIVLNLSTKNLKFFTKRFVFLDSFFAQWVFFCAPL